MSGVQESSNEDPVAAGPAATTAGNGVRVERVVSREAFLDLEAEWTDLLKRSDSDRVFFTHEWFRCWWEAFGQDGQLFVLCARRGDRLVGVAPLYASRSRFRGLPVRELRFMANGYSEECGFIVDAREPGVVRSLLGHLASARGEWDRLNLERVRLESALWRERAEAFEGCGLRYRTRPGLRVPYLLIDRSWEDFLALRSKTVRKQYRLRINRNRRRPEPIHVEKRVAPADVVQVLGSIYDVSSKSWKSDQGRAITSSPEAMRLFEALSRRLAENGWVSVWLATVGEKPVAFEYHLTYAGVTCPIRADFDEAYREISPGAYLEADVLRSVFEHPESGLAEYNSCGDSYEYLLHWSKMTREHATLRIAAPGWYGRILHLVGGLRRPRRGRAEVVDAEPTS